MKQTISFILLLCASISAIAQTDTSKRETVLDQVIISSTRSNRSIRNLPTRVEFVNGEELEEKANMKPGDIRMMLSESTGIQTQQVSATSANSSIRIQGLDGRYTQILKDGFPLFAGFSGGLGLLQTPPLDLRQVEIIKGSSSTLYGGGPSPASSISSPKRQKKRGNYASYSTAPPPGALMSMVSLASDGERWVLPSMAATAAMPPTIPLLSASAPYPNSTAR